MVMKDVNVKDVMHASTWESAIYNAILSLVILSSQRDGEKYVNLIDIFCGGGGD